MVKYTLSNHDVANAQLRETRRIAETLFVEGTDIVAQARGKLDEMVEKRKMHPVWEAVCWAGLGLCDLRETERTIVLLQGVIGTMGLHTSEAIQVSLRSGFRGFWLAHRLCTRPNGCPASSWTT